MEDLSDLKAGPGALAILKHYEQGPHGGFAAEPYHGAADKPGLMTVGWGHLVLPTDHFTYPMDAATAELLLERDLEPRCKQLAALLTRRPTQDQFDAMLCLVYNVGVGKADHVKGDFADSDLLAYFNAGRFDAFVGEFGKWVYSGGKVQNGLVYRRKTEALLASSGVVQFFN